MAASFGRSSSSVVACVSGVTHDFRYVTRGAPLNDVIHLLVYLVRPAPPCRRGNSSRSVYGKQHPSASVINYVGGKY